MTRAPFLRLTLVAVAVAITGSACERAPGARRGEAPSPPQVGDTAPAFNLPAADGSTVAMDDLTSRRPALFYFSMGPG